MMAPRAHCWKLADATWRMLVLLLTSLVTTRMAASDEVSCNLAEEDTFALLQTSQMKHRRAEEQERQPSFDEAEWLIAQDGESLQDLQVLQSPSREDAHALHSLMEEQEVAPQGTPRISGEPQMASDAQPASGAQAGSDVQPPTEDAPLHILQDAAQAPLQEQLQIVAKERDTAVAQVEESTQALQVARELLRQTLQQEKFAQAPAEHEVSSATVNSVSGIHFETGMPNAWIPGHITEAKQCRDGKQIWAGAIRIISGLAGRRESGAAPGQWEVGDTITDGECIPTPRLGSAITFDGQVSTPVGVLVWIFFAIAILCCGVFLAISSYAIVAKGGAGHKISRQPQPAFM